MMRTALRLLAVSILGLAAGAAAKPEQWKKVSTPTFTVITTVDDKAALAWAAEFSQFTATLGELIPVNPKLLPRLTVVLFARDRQFRDYRPLGADGQAQEVDGFFARSDAWAVAGLPATGLDEETRRTIFHEGTHWFLSGFENPNPVWLEEGVAEVFSTFAVEGKQVHWGRAIPEHVTVLRYNAAMPLSKLLFLAHSDLFEGPAESDVRTGLAYAQSWAFVHYLLFGDSKLKRTALNEYVRLSRTMDPDQAFRSAFGQTYEAMDMTLRAYIDDGRYFVSKWPAPPAAPGQIEPATPADVDEALARLAFAAKRRDKAMEHAKAVIRQDPEAPRGYELQGMLCEAGEDESGAFEAYKAAVARNSRYFRAYFMLAAMREYQLVTGSGGVTAADAREIANNYERAINCNARYEASYVGLAEILGHTEGSLENDANFLQLGHKVYPKNAAIAVGLAVADQRAGRKDDALRRLDEVLGRDDCPSETKAKAQGLRSEWGATDVTAEIGRLVNEGKLGEALKQIDAAMADSTDVTQHMWLAGARRDVAGRIQLSRAQRAGANRRWTEARAILKAVLESDAPPLIKTEAQKRLDYLDRRRLGLPKPPSAAPSAPAP